MRTVEPGINWIWYYADTKEDAERYFEELTGSKPTYDGIIFKDRDGRYAFRIHR